MITWFVLAAVLAYLVIGAFYARSQAARVWRERFAWWSDGSYVSAYPDLREQSEARWREHASRDLTGELVWRMAFWPCAALYDFLRGPVQTWLTAPAVEQQQRAAQLRSDARSWEEKITTGSPTERAMAAELARFCADFAREIER